VESAAAAAAHQLLVAFFPANQAAPVVRLTESLLAVPDGGAEDAGVARSARIASRAAAPPPTMETLRRLLLMP
jgi:hypothetical protein